MLEIDKSKVDFLVTASMVQEVQDILSRDLPQVKKIVDETLPRGIERVYFIACGSPLSAANTAAYLFDMYSRVVCKTYSGYDFLDAPPPSWTANAGDRHFAVWQDRKVTQSLILAKSRGAVTVAVTKSAENPVAQVTDYVVAYHAEAIWEAHLLVTYAFAYEIISRLEAHTKEITQIYEQLHQLPPLLEKLVNGYEETGRKLGEQASKYPFIYSVAAGPLLPLAYKEASSPCSSSPGRTARC